MSDQRFHASAIVTKLGDKYKCHSIFGHKIGSQLGDINSDIGDGVYNDQFENHLRNLKLPDDGYYEVFGFCAIHWYQCSYEYDEWDTEITEWTMEHKRITMQDCVELYGRIEEWLDYTLLPVLDARDTSMLSAIQDIPKDFRIFKHNRPGRKPVVKKEVANAQV